MWGGHRIVIINLNDCLGETQNFLTVVVVFNFPLLANWLVAAGAPYVLLAARPGLFIPLLDNFTPGGRKGGGGIPAYLARMEPLILAAQEDGQCRELAG